MESVSAPEQPVVLTIGDADRVADGRRAALELAEKAGFSDVQAGSVAIAASELGTNLLKHAGSGILQLRSMSDRGRTDIEILAIDNGPGMRDVVNCLRDGYSTVGTSGTGLGAVRRLSSAYDIYSTEGKGTV